MAIKFTVTSLFKNNQGSIELLMSVIVLTAILAVVLTASEIIGNGLVADKTQLDSTKAYFAAETATERILWHVRSQGNDLSSCIGQYIDFSPANSDYPAVASLSCGAGCTFTNYVGTLANYKYCIKCGTTMLGDTKLTGYGDYSGARRAVEVVY